MLLTSIVVATSLFLASPKPALPCPGRPRDAAPVQQFRKEHPCPEMCQTFIRENGKYVLYQKCGRCQVDHVCPLACCGYDGVQNFQWLTAEENRKKSADCNECRPELVDPNAVNNSKVRR